MKLTSLLMTLLFTGMAEAQDWKSRLQSARSIDNVVEFYEKFSKFGTPHKQQLDIGDQKYFAYWIDGVNGRGEFFWLYQLKNKSWNLVIDHPQVAAHSGSRVVLNIPDQQFQIISPSGEILARYPNQGEKAAPSEGDRLTN